VTFGKLERIGMEAIVAYYMTLFRRSGRLQEMSNRIIGILDEIRKGYLPNRVKALQLESSWSY